jgi:integrase
MTWIKSQRRWTKMYRGVRYYVSPKELGCPATEADSLLYANEWWRRRQAEIDQASRPSQPGSEAAVLSLLTAWKGSPLENQAEAVAAMGEVVNHIEANGLPDVVAEAILGKARLNRIKAAADVVDDDGAAPENTLAALADRFIALERTKIKTGKAGLIRVNMNRICLQHFVNWAGPDAEPTTLTSRRWVEAYTWLCGRLEEGSWSISHCDRILSLARRFIKWLWSLEYIELPRTLDDRAYTFHQHAKAVVHFTPDEIRRLRAAATGQTRLHILLSLNCGMTGKDISDLKPEEVDWEQGVITRKRSKTRAKENVPVVRFELWPETLALLKEYKSASAERVLLTQSGQPWQVTEDRDGRLFHSDKVASNLKWYMRKAGIKKPPKALRATAAQLLTNHATYKFYAQYFLGQAPDSVTGRHYTRPSDTEFWEALGWLRQQVLGVQ